MPINRDEAFVPLTTVAPAGSQRADFRVGIVSQAENAQPFRPLGSPASGQPAATHSAACDPRVEVKRQGDRVSSILIQCGCGQIIELACVYETPPNKP